jgi:hypothetical protein
MGRDVSIGGITQASGSINDMPDHSAIRRTGFDFGNTPDRLRGSKISPVPARTPF